jgi:hypothetical protein
MFVVLENYKSDAPSSEVAIFFTFIVLVFAAAFAALMSGPAPTWCEEEPVAKKEDELIHSDVRSALEDDKEEKVVAGSLLDCEFFGAPSLRHECLLLHP